MSRLSALSRRFPSTVVIFCLVLSSVRAFAESALTPDCLFGGEFDTAESEPSEESEFEIDRDSFTPATSTVREGRFFAETAWSFIDNRDVPEMA